MEPIVKIRRMGFHKLNNAEYAQFSQNTLSNLSRAGHLALGIPEAIVEEYRANGMLLTDILSKSRISDQTAQIVAADARCNEMLRFLFNLFDNGRLSPIEADREACTMLFNLIKPHRRIAWLPQNQQVAQTQGLIEDFGKARYAGLIERLNLSAVIEALDRANEELLALLQSRREMQAQRKLPAARTVRREMDAQYERMMAMAFATSLATPTPETAHFVTVQNNLITETNARYNLRMSLARHYKKEAEKRRSAST